MLTLGDLVSSRLRERGWSLNEVVRRSDGRISRSRWQQYSANARMLELPRVAHLQALADVLEVDLATVIFAAARTVGLDVRRRGPDLAHLLPAGTDLLTTEMRDGLLAVIRAAVAEAARRHSERDEDRASSGSGTSPGGVYEWDEGEPSLSRRNADRRAGESGG